MGKVSIYRDKIDTKVLVDVAEAVNMIPDEAKRNECAMFLLNYLTLQPPIRCKDNQYIEILRPFILRI